MATIFLLDDETELLEVMEKEFFEEGFDVCLYDNPHVFIDSFNSLKCDMVVSDIRMPLMNGFDIFKLVQRKLGEKCPPYIFFTAYHDFSRAELLKEGATELFEKPESFKKMSDFIRAELAK